MKLRITSRRVPALLVAIAMLLPALSASGSQQALVRLVYKALTNNSTSTIGPATGVATVATGTPTPSVMWPAGIAKSTTTFTTSGPYLSFRPDSCSSPTGRGP